MYDDVEVHQSPLFLNGQPDNVDGSYKGFSLPERSFIEPGTFVIQEKYFANIVEL